MEPCLGYYNINKAFHSGTNKEFKACPKELLYEEPSYNEEDEIQWYPEPFLKVEILKVLLDILIVSELLIMVKWKTVCASFVRLFLHQHAFGKGSEKNTKEILKQMEEIQHELQVPRQKLVSRNFTRNKRKTGVAREKSTLLTFDITRLKKFSKQWKKEIKELANSGTIGEVASSLMTSFKKGNVKGKDRVVNIMKVTAKNLAKKPKGQR